MLQENIITQWKNKRETMYLLFRNMFYIEVGTLDEWISILQLLPKTFHFHLKTFKICLECKLSILTIHLKVAS